MNEILGFIILLLIIAALFSIGYAACKYNWFTDLFRLKKIAVSVGILIPIITGLWFAYILFVYPLLKLNS